MADQRMETQAQALYGQGAGLGLLVDEGSQQADLALAEPLLDGDGDAARFLSPGPRPLPRPRLRPRPRPRPLPRPLPPPARAALTDGPGSEPWDPAAPALPLPARPSEPPPSLLSPELPAAPSARSSAVSAAACATKRIR